MVKVKTKKKKSRQVDVIVLHVQSTFNNTIITATDFAGNVLAWGSGGQNFKSGARKATAYNGQQIMKQVLKKVVENNGAKRVAEVKLKGPGSARESAVRVIKSEGLDINSMAIVDVTPIPHNGCRPKKRRRV